MFDIDDDNDVNAQFYFDGWMDGGIDTCKHCKKDIESDGEDDRRAHLEQCQPVILLHGLDDLILDIDGILQTDDKDVLHARAQKLQDNLEKLVDNLGLTKELY